MLSMALQAGVHSAGIDTVDVGVMPAGAISHLTYTASAEMAAIVSASHNPAEDNGIKFLDKLGSKLSDDDEDRIEKQIRSSAASYPYGANVGTRFLRSDALDQYVEDLASDSWYTFRGIEIMLDCANGAAYQAAPALFKRLGADVVATNAEPNGMNINSGCGATHPEFVAAAADGRVGLAFDGDADRLIATDEDGHVVDGDRIIAIIARHWAKGGKLKNNKVVATVMSNLGFRKAMEEAGIDLVTTRVGDRYVMEAMNEHRAILGGEQSGHVIFLDRARTGDGLLTAVRLLEVMAGTGRRLADLSQEAMTTYPQVLVNVRVPSKEGLEEATDLWEEVEDVERLLAGNGRVLIRPSGTEPLIRVMVEASSEADANGYAERLAGVVESVFGSA
jgi:phosphoglucosamine mutase